MYKTLTDRMSISSRSADVWTGCCE